MNQPSIVINQNYYLMHKIGIILIVCNEKTHDTSSWLSHAVRDNSRIYLNDKG